MMVTRRQLLLGTTASVACNVGLAYTLGRARRPSAHPNFDVAPPLSLTDSGAGTVEISYKSGRATFLYYFSTTCPWCQRNLENFKSLAQQQGKTYDFFAVAPDDSKKLADYQASNYIAFPLYTIQSPDSAKYGFRGTPNSMLISVEGRFVSMWEGAYRERSVNEIERALRIKLPGPIRVRQGLPG